MDRADYLPSATLRGLAHAVDPKMRLEPEAEQVCHAQAYTGPRVRRPPERLSSPRQILQDVADDFVENLAAFACELAVHRAGTTLEARDIQLALGACALRSLRPGLF